MIDLMPSVGLRRRKLGRIACRIACSCVVERERGGVALPGDVYSLNPCEVILCATCTSTVVNNPLPVANSHACTKICAKQI